MFCGKRQKRRSPKSQYGAFISTCRPISIGLQKRDIGIVKDIVPEDDDQFLPESEFQGEDGDLNISLALRALMEKYANSFLVEDSPDHMTESIRPRGKVLRTEMESQSQHTQRFIMLPGLIRSSHKYCQSCGSFD